MQGLSTLNGDSLGKHPDILGGSIQAEVLLGGAWGDFLSGGGSDEWLDGGAGYDAMFGGTGNADAILIICNAGNNTLAGKLGNDTLIGGDGQDVFVFDTALSASNRDTIYNFIVAGDTIQLNRSVFSALTPGALAPGAFVTGAAALDTNDRIIYNSATGALRYDADGSGAGVAVQFATLIGVVGTLDAADFMVV